MPQIPLAHSKFTLNTSGVAGFFGGDEAVSAMATVHMYEGRKWLGWYNSPGSYLVAKRYGQLANSRFWDGLFPGVNTDPATLFELDGWKGPAFQGVQSGSMMSETGHVAALMAKECQSRKGIEVDGRKTQPVGVTIIDLHHVPEATVEPKQLRKYTSVFALIPILVSISTCVVCAVFQDWYSFSMILLGIITSGISCLVIGSGKFTFYHPDPAPGAPPEYRNIGICSLLLTTQFIAQLLLIPQGTIFGQIMFVTSLAVSWAYNSWLSSLDKEEIQRKLLLDVVLKRPSLRKFLLGTRTTMAVFVLLALKPLHPDKVLDDILPNDTKVWKRWKTTILSRIEQGYEMNFELADWHDESFDEQESTLLKTLFNDAHAAYIGYTNHLKSS
ncbi:uncharacterized protein EDB91DRAFT_1191027 [Suillus paluster]|uniref:uncharacterized protein n=1 Tax=Suillus paluster TaxID=48578 RepID=UPI001B8777AF|nr:uncharacterized protein EDB91DRAFT_1191027 [Suillus paluster]KAG1717467.1 hypothetical protein EDB91DRAFT_1191027 [Suillus paluster]